MTDIIEKYFPNLQHTQKQHFDALWDLYHFWNNQVNVISRKDIDNLYLNHVLHSLSIAKLLQFKNQTSILDVGTGGGFPGIPLAIMFPNAEFHLVDSIGKKIKVTQSIAEELHLSNVKCTQERVENLTCQYDFIVSRAVTILPDFLKWTQNKVLKFSFNSIANGILYLKGGDLSEERQQLGKKSFQYGISEWFEEDFFKEKYIIHIPLGNKPIESMY